MMVKNAPGCFFSADQSGSLWSRPFFHLLEQRGLQHSAAHPVAEGQDDDADEERHPPAPGVESVRGHGVREDQVDPVGEHQTDKRAGLHHAAAKSTLTLRRGLDGQQHRPAPFPANGESLHRSQQHQQRGGGHPDLGVRRQDTDQSACTAHEQQGEGQHALTPDAVTKVPEHGASNRTEEEAHGERREGGQRPVGDATPEVELAQDQSCRRSRRGSSRTSPRPHRPCSPR